MGFLLINLTPDGFALSPVLPSGVFVGQGAFL
jgi:hypothetical protein